MRLRSGVASIASATASTTAAAVVRHWPPGSSAPTPDQIRPPKAPAATAPIENAEAVIVQRFPRADSANGVRLASIDCPHGENAARTAPRIATAAPTMIQVSSVIGCFPAGGEQARIV